MEARIALIISIPLTVAYAYLMIKNFGHYLKRFHRINELKKRRNLTMTEANIIGVEPRELCGRKWGMCMVYAMNITYTTENAARGVEHSEIILTRKPTQKMGGKIRIFYNREEPSFPMTIDGSETDGETWLIVRIAVSITIVFGIIYLVMYGFGKYGLPDDL